MPAWNAAARKADDVCVWLDNIIDSAAEGLHIDYQAMINLKDGFIQKLYLVDEEEEALPLGLILNGPDAATKRSLAESLASRLGINFIYADCEAYAAREAAHRTAKPTTVQVPRAMAEERDRSAREMLLAEEYQSLGMMGWLCGGHPGAVIRDVDQSLAQMLKDEPCQLVYFDNTEKAGSRFYGALCSIIERGEFPGSAIAHSGIPIGDTIFVFSTNLRLMVTGRHSRSGSLVVSLETEGASETIYSKPLGAIVDETESYHRFTAAWRASVDQDDRFISRCSIVLM
jgi:hypothetical protein